MPAGPKPTGAPRRRRSLAAVGPSCACWGPFRYRSNGGLKTAHHLKPLAAAVAGRRSAPSAGFTLLELIVVILLLSILLGFAIPAFQTGATGARDRVARELLHAVKKLKIAALSRQSIHRLHLDLNQNRIWVTREDKVAAEGISPRQSERTLPESIRVAHVRLADNREIRSGTVEILFYPQGHSDRAVIRLTDGGDEPVDVVIEAFLPMALIASNDGAAAF